MEAAGAQPSIHQQRRWWYALWGALLLVCLAGWAWWETPASREQGHVAMTLVTPLPPGTKVDWWIGPRDRWRGNGTVYAGTLQEAGATQGKLKLPLLQVDMALRRRHRGYIPRGTTDWIVLRIQVPEQPARFASYDLGVDMAHGLMGPHRRLNVSLPFALEKLSQDASYPTRLQ